MKELYVIVDLQYGSTGKGLLAGYLANRRWPDAVVMAWGPNAGHTFISAVGGKMVNIALPNGIVSSKLRRIFIGPGSVINPTILLEEMDRYSDYLEGVDIVIHGHAAIVQERHRVEEASTGLGIGSTMKGVGAAMQEKIRRNVHDQITAQMALRGTALENFIVTDHRYQELLDEAEIVQVEGSQGYSLSINHGFYPYTTSRDCTTMQILSDCGIPMNVWNQLRVYGVTRTYPIRVANRYKEGIQIGYSGPCYPDQQEISWANISIPPELTTVTKLPRRIFTFSELQVAAAIRQNGVDTVFLNFANYCTGDILPSIIEKIEKHAPVTLLGWGATERDIIQRS